jgi:hypothetical protein
MLAIAVTGMSWMSVEVVKSITEGRFLGIWVTQRDAILRFAMPSKAIVIFHNPEVVQKELLVLDEIVLRKQRLLTLLLERSRSLSYIFGTECFSITPLGSYRLSRTEGELFNLFREWSGHGNRGCHIHTGSLNTSGWSSAAVEENDFNLPNLSFGETCAVCSSQDPNPSALLISEGLFGTLRRLVKVFLGFSQGVLGDLLLCEDRIGVVEFGLFSSFLHLSELPAHHGQLPVVDAQSDYANNSQSAIDGELADLYPSKFSRKLLGGILVGLGYFSGVVANFAFGWSGWSHWRWRRRLILGFFGLLLSFSFVMARAFCSE